MSAASRTLPGRKTQAPVRRAAGSGKSSLLPVAAAGVDHFNIDDRCAQLNRGR
jgi:hypothetical protein